MRATIDSCGIRRLPWILMSWITCSRCPCAVAEIALQNAKKRGRQSHSQWRTDRARALLLRLLRGGMRWRAPPVNVQVLRITPSPSMRFCNYGNTDYRANKPSEGTKFLPDLAGRISKMKARFGAE